MVGAYECSNEPWVPVSIADFITNRGLLSSQIGPCFRHGLSGVNGQG
jgi:hypothetical protein